MLAVLAVLAIGSGFVCAINGMMSGYGDDLTDEA